MYHILNIVGGYFLMLVVMTYNAWLFLAVVLGTGFAYYITGPLILLYLWHYNNTHRHYNYTHGESDSEEECFNQRPNKHDPAWQSRMEKAPNSAV